jgi:hypothetical protein
MTHWNEAKKKPPAATGGGEVIPNDRFNSITRNEPPKHYHRIF